MTDNKSGAMTKKNWIIVFAGIGVFLFGFFVLAQVGKNYHGFFGLLAPLMLIAGLLVISWGLLAPGE